MAHLIQLLIAPLNKAGGITTNCKCIKLLISILWVVSAGVAGCGDDDGGTPAGPDAVSDLWPMRVGNYWDFVTKTFFNDDLVMQDTFRLEVDTALFFGAERWFRMTEEAAGAAVFYRPGEGGVYRLIFNPQHPQGLEELWLKHPTAVGESWHSQIAGGTCEVVSIDTQVTVPFGDIEGCLYYHLETYEGETEDMFVRPELGPVIIVRQGKEGSLTVRTEHALLDYYLR